MSQLEQEIVLALFYSTSLMSESHVLTVVQKVQSANSLYVGHADQQLAWMYCKRYMKRSKQYIRWIWIANTCPKFISVLKLFCKYFSHSNLSRYQTGRVRPAANLFTGWPVGEVSSSCVSQHGVDRSNIENIWLDRLSHCTFQNRYINNYCRKNYG